MATRSDDDFPRHLGEYHGALNREWRDGAREGAWLGFIIGLPIGMALLMCIAAIVAALR